MSLQQQALTVDLVYTWVNDGEEAYRRLLQKYATTPVDLNPERTRDVYTLLKYSLRSVARFVPWVRDIYIVTCRPQRPDWLNLDHPNVNIVHHDEIFDDPRYLPTFNCNCIESYIHRIPGLSDYFLYLNDDFLFGRDIVQDDFMAGDRLLVYGTVMGERIPFVYDNRRNDIVSFLQHTPLLIYKPYYKAMIQDWAEEVHQTRSRRFRTRRDVMMHGLYRYYCLKHQSAHAQAVPCYSYLKYYRFHKITNDYRKQRKQLERIQAMRPKFYCMNDDQGDTPDKDVVRRVQTFLNEYYPEKSPYER
jgi:hypothetical protein